MSIESEYDDAFWRAGMARKALAVIDEALYSLKLQRRALEAEMRAREHAFAGFIVSHPEVREIDARRAAERREALAALAAADPAPSAGPTEAPG